MKIDRRNKNEIDHFSHLDHIWWGALTVAGQKRYDNKLTQFKRYCHPKKEAKILEIGCGDGEFTKRLATLNAQIIATDVTPKVITKGKKLIKAKNVKFLVDDSHDMKFKDNSFDFVCGVSILHHLETEKALEECYRVLKPGGQLFFTEPNLLNPHILLGLNIPWLREKMEYSPDETALIRWRMVEMLKRIGFRIVKVDNYDFLHPKTPESIMKLVEQVSDVFEKLPLIKEISGSLIVFAQK